MGADDSGHSGHSGGPVTGDDPDDHGGHNDAPPAITPPGVGASQTEINSYLNALASQSEVHVHDSNEAKAGEHNAAMDLVPRGDATHVAIGDGDWFDPSIWSNGEVPGDNAKVLIPDGVAVEYGGVSDARLFTVRIDGALDFATDVDSKMIFDTMVATPTGHLIIGTASDPVDPNVDINLIVANNGPIDTNWDPMLLSRGIIAHGETTIHGAVKDSHEKVIDDPMAGDTSVKFAEIPEGWQVGDTIVIAGTRYDGHSWDNTVKDVVLHPSEDEVRVITAIEDDGTIRFDEALVHDHDAPRADLKTSVANYTRNISVETENADTAEVYERGHVMFMHSDNVDVRYAEFHELGRTDKSEPAHSANEGDDFDANVQGRYSLHLHRTGLNDIDDPAILVGNAVYGSPGWGFVHHDSNALLENNASFDTFGAGFVAETGNEIGAWDDNIAILAQGVSWDRPKNTSLLEEFDIARGGDGFWFQGRMVESSNNVAASVNTGFVYFHRDGSRDDGMIDFDADLFAYPEALLYNDQTSPQLTPILSFEGNEVIAAFQGLHVVKANPNQEHDVWSVLKDFTAWNVYSGVHLEYTAHYLLQDFDLIGRSDENPYLAFGTGVHFGNNTGEVVIADSSVDNFINGINFNKSWVSQFEGMPDALHKFIVVDTDVINTDNTFLNYDPSIDRVISRDDVSAQAPDLQLDTSRLVYGDWQSGTTVILNLTGTKSDSLGQTDYPGGVDTFQIKQYQMQRVLDEKGYYTTPDGEDYFLMEIYLTDRLTGEVYAETHPVYLTHSTYGASFNGVQDITNQGGTLYAGDTPLDVAVPYAAQAQQTSAAMVEDEQMAEHMHAASTLETWLSSYDGTDGPDFGVDQGLFVNTGEITNAGLLATGGETVLASDDSEFDLAPSKTLAVFAEMAKIGFDGEEGGMALLDMHEGSTLAFAAEDGDLGTIEEFDSSAFDGPTDVQSGIDLGNATLSLDLTGLSAEAGTAFTLMDSDEIVGLFKEAVVGGLGDRDARILIDYETDTVTLELAPNGNGAVAVETQGAETDVTLGSEALWDALTDNQGMLGDVDALTDEEGDLLDAA